MSKKCSDDKLVEYFNDIDWSHQIKNDEIKDLMVGIESKIMDSELQNSSSSSVAIKEENYDNLINPTRIKLVVVGDGAVGKTCILISFKTKKFPSQYIPTVFENYTAPFKSCSKNGRRVGDDSGTSSGTAPVLLHLWDTAGQEEYDRLRPLSYPNSDVVLLCFATVNRGSFESIKNKWFPEVNHYIKDVPKILVGTKVDLRESGTADPHASEYEPIPKTEAEALAKELGITRYIEVSAKTRKNLNKVFETAVDCALSTPKFQHLKNKEQQGNNSSNNTNINSNSNSNSTYSSKGPPSPSSSTTSVGSTPRTTKTNRPTTQHHTKTPSHNRRCIIM